MHARGEGPERQDRAVDEAGVGIGRPAGVDEDVDEPMTRQEASLFFRLVSYRYGRGAMLITTNKSIRDWTELLAGDEVLATAILDRLLHRSHVLNIKGRSYRLRDLEDALKLAHAWAIRKASPQLMEATNAFVAKASKGTELGNGRWMAELSAARKVLGALTG